MHNKKTCVHKWKAVRSLIENISRHNSVFSSKLCDWNNKLCRGSSETVFLFYSYYLCVVIFLSISVYTFKSGLLVLCECSVLIVTIYYLSKQLIMEHQSVVAIDSYDSIERTSNIPLLVCRLKPLMQSVRLFSVNILQTRKLFKSFFKSAAPKKLCCMTQEFEVNTKNVSWIKQDNYW